GGGGGSTPWFEAGTEFFVPGAHAEGRFCWFPAEEGAEFPADQVAFRYRARVGDGPAQYPDDPNGSHGSIAGVTNRAGNVLGMMPHPERFLVPEHHPQWMRYRTSDGAPPAEEDLPVPLGLEIYRRAVASCR
ncbi:MAG: phosphoribosylformylglycinamidine synthase subunit PurQ, partial [Planctomycetota bacterium]